MTGPLGRDARHTTASVKASGSMAIKNRSDFDRWGPRSLAKLGTENRSDTWGESIR